MRAVHKVSKPERIISKSCQLLDKDLRLKQRENLNFSLSFALVKPLTFYEKDWKRQNYRKTEMKLIMFRHNSKDFTLIREYPSMSHGLTAHIYITSRFRVLTQKDQYPPFCYLSFFPLASDKQTSFESQH